MSSSAAHSMENRTLNKNLLSFFHAELNAEFYALLIRFFLKDKIDLDTATINNYLHVMSIVRF